MVSGKERAEGLGGGLSVGGVGEAVFECGMKKGGGAGEGWAVCWGYE